MSMIRACKNCGQMFSPTKPRISYCSNRCGNLSRRAKLVNGSVVGKWTILAEPTKDDDRSHWRYPCRCECGATHLVRRDALIAAGRRGGGCRKCIARRGNIPEN